MSKLGDYTKIRTGKLDANASSKNGAYPFFTCSREPLKIDQYSYDCECVLVAGNGDLNVKYYNGKFDAYQRTYIIESNDNEILFVPYLYLFLDHYLETLREQSIGGVIKYIKLGNLTDAEIPLPPLDEQKIIANELDIISGLITKRKRQIEKLDLLVKVKFVEMFGDPVTNPMGWPRINLSDCLINIENGKSFICESYCRSKAHPAILKLSAVTYGIYHESENKSIINTEEFVERAEVKPGDLLFTRKNTPELVGMCAYVFSTTPKLMMPDLIFRLNTTDKCNKIYLWKLINHDLFRNEIASLATGSAKSMSNISKERLNNLSIPLPPIAIQTQFAEFVEKVEQTKTQMQTGLSKLETLYKARMQQYFE